MTPSLSFSHSLPDGRRVALRADGGSLTLDIDDHPGVRLRRQSQADDALTLALVEFDAVDGQPELLLGAALSCLFESMPALRQVNLDLGGRRDLAEPLHRHGFALGLAAEGGAVACPRGLARQRPDLWLTQPREATFPLRYTMTDGKRHPLRPPIARGEVYRRPLPSLDTLLSFRTIDPETDLEVFHRWMNTPRVFHFWELEGSLEDHERYLRKVLADAHMHPVVGCFDGQPFGYFEIYWAREDRIAPYYTVDDYDRGIHMLVGEERFRGPHRVLAWLPSLAHYLFLDDPRTRNVVAEPRADNAKMISYMQRVGFHKAKEFDFPHKRAALMVLPREVFFEQFCP
jgi:acetyl CoA:N6-hydroxylysine acetyl transferase